jgi:hypothetical protein
LRECVCVSTACGNLYSNGTARMITADTARAMRACGVYVEWHDITHPFSAVDGFASHVCIVSRLCGSTGNGACVQLTGGGAHHYGGGCFSYHDGVWQGFAAPGHEALGTERVCNEPVEDCTAGHGTSVRVMLYGMTSHTLPVSPGGRLSCHLVWWQPVFRHPYRVCQGFCCGSRVRLRSMCIANWWRVERRLCLSTRAGTSCSVSGGKETADCGR